MEWVGWKGLRVSKYVQICITFLDAIASPSTYPCQSVSGSVIDSFRLEIAIASPSFASLFWREVGPCRQNFYSGKHKKIEEEKLLSQNISERKCQMILEGATKWCLTNFADGTFPQERPLQPKVLELLSLSKVLL